MKFLYHVHGLYYTRSCSWILKWYQEKNKPRVQVSVAEKVKEMDGCSDRGKDLSKLALALDLLHV